VRKKEVFLASSSGGGGHVWARSFVACALSQRQTVNGRKRVRSRWNIASAFQRRSGRDVGGRRKELISRSESAHETHDAMKISQYFHKHV